MTDTPVRRCESLSPSQADALFFPGSGGKPHKADKFCSGCPFQSECLDQVLNVPDMEGFWCGTTKEQRAEMRKFRTSAALSIADVMPKEPAKDSAAKSKYLVVAKTEDAYAWLDEKEPSLLELIMMR